MDSSAKISQTLAHVKSIHKHTNKAKHFQEKQPNILGFRAELRTIWVQVKQPLIVFKLSIGWPF